MSTLTYSEIKEAMTLMAGRLKVDYPNFNLEFFRRRLSYVFEKMSLRRLDDLKRVLSSIMKDDEVTYYMAVPCTELLRAPEFWVKLRELLSKAGDGKKIWFPCLSSYHELYSLLIVLNNAGLRNCEIVANVISDNIARDVRSRRVSRHYMDMDRENLALYDGSLDFASYVETDEDGPRFRLSLPSNLTIRNGWFMNTDDEAYDVIIFRHALLCYNKLLHVRAVTKLVNSLAGQGSLLCIGSHERPLAEETRLDSGMENLGIYVAKA